MQLTKQQAEAIKRFESVGYVEIDAPRRSGKTFMIREYIKANPKKLFGIYTENYRQFKQQYEDLKNATYMDNLSSDKKLSVVVGDEKFIKSDKPTMIVRTSRALFWGIENIKTKELSNFKKDLDKNLYNQEFKKYENI